MPISRIREGSAGYKEIGFSVECGLIGLIIMMPKVDVDAVCVPLPPQCPFP